MYGKEHATYTVDPVSKIYEDYKVIERINYMLEQSVLFSKSIVVHHMITSLVHKKAWQISSRGKSVLYVCKHNAVATGN